MSTIAVEVRDDTGKGVARKLRAAGRIPAVLYGQDHEPVSLSLEPRTLDKLLHSEGLNALFDLDGSESVKGRTVLVKAVQRHPVRGDLMHADFFEIDARKTITVSVGIHLEGTPVGVSLDGGVLDHALREVELDCLPRAIPESLVLDVSQMGLGESLHVSDIPLPDGVEMRTHDELSVVSVVAPRVEEEAPEVAEGEEGQETPAAAADGGSEGGEESAEG